MINCSNITKHYNGETILKNFNYYFQKGKMYFIYGRSGSGKTTLLNIICGLVNYDDGNISFEFDSKKYYKQVDNNQIMENVAYISQHTYLINYLSVFDNLILCNNDKKEIIKILKQFNLLYLKDKMPITLSGGEKQRIAIMQAILMKKTILLLDEPTASLDYENKIKVFELLYSLKEEVTILISSHDTELTNYCDEVVDLEHQKKYEAEVKENFNLAVMEKTYTIKKVELKPYMIRQFTYSKFEKKESKLLIAVFIIAILICFLCGSPQQKLLSNIDKIYKVNQLQIICNNPNLDICKKILNEDSVEDVVIDYAMNIEQKGFADGRDYDYDYEITLVTLPYEENNFRLSNRVLYGTFYENKYDVMISYDYAKAMIGGGDFESIIGKKIKIKLENGEEEFRICGIFDQFVKKDYMYFQAMGLYPEQVNYNIFLNSKFTKDYYENPTYYYLFFNDFKSANKIYNQYKDESNITIIPYDSSFSNVMTTFSMISYIFYPLGIIGIIVSLLFYFQRLMTKLEYYKFNYCTYNYYGYNKKYVKKSFFVVNIYQIIKKLVVATLIACFIGLLLNKFNDLFVIFSFKLFNFNFPLLILFYSFVLFVSVISLYNTSKEIEKMGWYNVLQETRDLL